MALKFAKPQKVTRTGASSSLAEVRALAAELAEATIAADGTDNLPEGGWVSPIEPHASEGSEYTFLHFEDARAATGLAYAIRTGRTFLSKHVALDVGYFAVEANSCGTDHKVVITSQDGKATEHTRKGSNLSLRFVTRNASGYDAAAHQMALGYVLCEVAKRTKKGEVAKDKDGNVIRRRTYVHRDDLEASQKADATLRVVQDTPTGRKPVRKATKRTAEVTVSKVDPETLPEAKGSADATERAIAKKADEAKAKKADEAKE